MNKVLSRPIDISKEITDTLEEGKKYQMLEAKTLPMQIGNSVVIGVWLREHGTKRMFAVAFTGDIPDTENFIVKDGKARKTDPMPMP